MANRMLGKVAIVTGGGGGIGAATAELFCREGAKVLIVDQNADMAESTRARIAAAGTQDDIAVLVGDVADGDMAQSAVALAVERFGTLNVLINNAAIRNHATVEAANRDDWNRILAINLIGAVNFSKAALTPMRRSGHASIVMVSSGYALTGRKGSAAYDATKAALLSLTRTLACEEVDNGIRVNAICPGSTATPFTIGRGKARGLSEAEFFAEVRNDSLMKRWARLEEITYPIMWLACDEASYITGTTLMVDGGLSIM